MRVRSQTPASVGASILMTVAVVMTIVATATAELSPPEHPASELLCTAEGPSVAVTVPESSEILAGGLSARSICTASVDCYDGSTVSCTGNSLCSPSPDQVCLPDDVGGSVTCDGNTTSCPPCPDCSVTNMCETVQDCYEVPHCTPGKRAGCFSSPVTGCTFCLCEL